MADNEKLLENQLNNGQEPNKRTWFPPDFSLKEQIWKNWRVLSCIGLQFVVLITWGLVMVFWAWLHGVTSLNDPVQIANVDFIGVTDANPDPSVWSLFLAMSGQSIAGVLARSQFRLMNIVIKGRTFYLLKNISQLIGDVTLGTGITVGTIYLFRITSVTIAQTEFTLRNADIETIVAIAFILGFFYEDSRKLLENFHAKLLGESKSEG